MEREWFRTALIAFLQEVGSSSCSASVDDLVSIWVNHLYVPAVPWSAYLPEVHNEALVRFQRCFNEQGSCVLSEFHARIVATPESKQPERQRMLTCAAQEALTELAG